MRPVSVRLSSATFSSWIPLDRNVSGFVTGLGVKLSSNGNLTCSVQHTFDNVLQATPLAIAGLTRVTTTLTVPITNHGLSVADYVGLKGFGAPFDGDYAVASVVDQNNVTVTVSNSGATFAPYNGGVCVTARVFNHATLAGLTASADGNYSAPPAACRLIVTAYTAGYVDLNVIQAGR